MSLLNFSTESFVNSRAFLQSLILSSHSLFSKGPRSERSSAIQSFRVSRRWKRACSIIILFFSFLLTMALPHAIVGRIQVGFQPEEEWKRIYPPMPFFTLSESTMKLKQNIEGIKQENKKKGAKLLQPFQPTLQLKA